LKGGPAGDSDEVVNMSVSCHISTDPHTTRPKLVPKQAAETTVDRLEEAISNPGAVKINVKGAFIVENNTPPSENRPEGEGVYYELKDIRLPHHTSVVSHVAVDVSLVRLLFVFSSPHGSSAPAVFVVGSKRCVRL
jgi:type II pantothenate kinase